MLRFIESKAKMVARDTHGYRIAHGSYLLHQDPFSRHTTHFHQFQEDFIVIEFFDGSFLSWL